MRARLETELKLNKYHSMLDRKGTKCNIPPVEARAGTAFPRDVPRAVAERSEAEWSRPEQINRGKCRIKSEVCLLIDDVMVWQSTFAFWYIQFLFISFRSSTLFPQYHDSTVSEL